MDALAESEAHQATGTISPTQLAWLTAQETHGLIGILTVVLSAWIFPSNYHVLVAAVVVLLVIAFLKEAFWDPVHETDQPFFWEGAEDFSFYVVGIVAGLGILFLAHHFVGVAL